MWQYMIILMVTVPFLFLIIPKSLFTRDKPRENAAKRILLMIAWWCSTLTFSIIIGIVAICNWFYQIITNKKDIGITRKIVDWWLDWQSVIWYGYAR